MSKELQKAFVNHGIVCLTGTKVQKIEPMKAGVKVTVTSEEGEQTLEAEQALMAIGYKPNSLHLGLEEIGVELSERKHINVDNRMSTHVLGVWAIGDVSGKSLLAHTAMAQGILCAEAIAGKPVHPIDYVMIPRATYSHPQIASFGFTEAQARERGLAVRVGKFPFQPNGKALGLGESTGFVKVIVDEEYGEILGAHDRCRGFRTAAGAHPGADE